MQAQRQQPQPQQPLPQEVKVRIPHPQQTNQQSLHPLPRQVVVRLHHLPLAVHLVLGVVHLVVTTVEGIKDLVKNPKLS